MKLKEILLNSFLTIMLLSLGTIYYIILIIIPIGERISEHIGISDDITKRTVVDMFIKGIDTNNFEKCVDAFNAYTNGSIIYEDRYEAFIEYVINIKHPSCVTFVNDLNNS